MLGEVAVQVEQAEVHPRLQAKLALGRAAEKRADVGEAIALLTCLQRGQHGVGGAGGATAQLQHLQPIAVGTDFGCTCGEGLIDRRGEQVVLVGTQHRDGVTRLQQQRRQGELIAQQVGQAVDDLAVQGRHAGREAQFGV
ncbi:hypothetical protein D3C76_802170 [compost metagenome]